MQPDRFIGSREIIAARIAQQVALAANSAINERGIFSIAVPGGSVAEVCLPLIAQLDLEWEKVHVFWCDERAVPLEKPDSNAGAAFKLWHDTPLSRGAILHVMNGAVSDFDRVIMDYATDLKLVAGVPPVLDVVLLGVGEDGHIASLFPGHATVGDTARLVMLETESPKPPAKRLTVSMPVLTGARSVIVAAFGAGKATVMQQALENEHSDLPVSMLVRRAARISIMLDPAAASQLRGELQ